MVNWKQLVQRKQLESGSTANSYTWMMAIGASFGEAAASD
jgi:hypothetical protein